MYDREPYLNSRLHPKAREVFGLLEYRLKHAYETGQTPTLFRPFEGFRTAARQDYLFTIEKTTKAKGWQSAHNYGLAVDFVPLRDATALTSWDWGDQHDWLFLKEAATATGLISTIRWDKPHVEHPLWQSIKRQLV